MPNVPDFSQGIKFISDSAHEYADCPMVREHLQDWDSDQPEEWERCRLVM